MHYKSRPRRPGFNGSLSRLPAKMNRRRGRRRRRRRRRRRMRRRRRRRRRKRRKKNVKIRIERIMMVKQGAMIVVSVMMRNVGPM